MEIDSQKPLNRKQKLFVQNYTTRGTETYGNGLQSALKAGYSPRCAEVTASKMLRYPNVLHAMHIIDVEYQKQFDLCKNDLIIEARENYNSAKTDTMRKYWNDTYLMLKGWNVQKHEVDNTITYSQAEEDEIQYLRSTVGLN